MNSIPAPEPWTDASNLLRTPAALRARFQDEGFVCLRGLVNPAPTHQLAPLIRHTLADQGLLGGRGLPTPRWQTDDPHRLAMQRAVLRAAPTRTLRQDPALLTALEAVLGARATPGGGDVVRVRGADERTQPHQDRAYIAQERLVTVWLPLEVCSWEHGPLAVLRGSHRGGLLPHPAGADAEAGVSPVPRGAWVSGPLAPGDAVIFDGLTLHGALPTQADRLRLSIDLRFVPAD